MAQKPGLGSAKGYLTVAERPVFRYKEPWITSAINESPCQSCGACCSYSENWPRFTTEDDAALDLIPPKFVNERLSGMRCDGHRCSALSGKIGEATSCTIYTVRPEVCRTCMPGDPECAMARKRHGLPVLG
jgi:Fe-S-cluster containining protein